MKRKTRTQVRRTLDNRLKSMPASSNFIPPKQSWIKTIRESLGMSAKDLGTRLDVSQQAVLALELSEAEGRVRINTLRKAAEALECDFVYTFIPKTGLENSVRKQATSVFEETMKKVSHSMKLEAQDTVLSEADQKELLDSLIASGNIWHEPN